MSDIVERLRTIPRSGSEIGHTWNLCDDAADEIEKLRAENANLAASNHAYLSNYQEAADEIEKLRAENENLRKTIRDGIKLIDLDAVKSFRKTLKWALGEKE